MKRFIRRFLGLHEVRAEIAQFRDLAICKLETIMIDTSKLLAEVARERTELASWKALSAAKDKAMADVAAALKTATEALAAAGADTAALAQVQADLDKAATDLKNDNDEAEAALTANTSTATTGGVQT